MRRNAVATSATTSQPAESSASDVAIEPCLGNTARSRPLALAGTPTTLAPFGGTLMMLGWLLHAIGQWRR